MTTLIMTNSIGDSRKQHPIPLRLRSLMIDKDQGGSKGYRGRGFSKARLRALYLGRYRSSATGLPQGSVTLEVDHIIGYRIAGITEFTNKQTNLRITDTSNNKFLDTMEGFQEKPPVRRLRSY